MSFPKAQRFNDGKKENSDSPSPSRSIINSTKRASSSHRILRFNSSLCNKSVRSSSSSTSVVKPTIPTRSQSAETHKDPVQQKSKTSLKERLIKTSIPRAKTPVSRSTTQIQAPGSKKPATCSFIGSKKPATCSFIDDSAQVTPTQTKSPPKPVSINGKQVQRILETQFHTKKKQFENMKKELSGKQKYLLNLYTSMLELQKRAKESTGKDLGPLEEIKLVDFGTMKAIINTANLQTSTEPRQADGACKGVAFNSLGVNKESDNELIAKMKMKLQTILQQYTVMVQQLLVKRYETCEWLKDIKNKVEEEDFKKQINQYIGEGNNLNKQIEELKNVEDKTIDEMVQDIKSQINILKPLDKNKGDLKNKLQTVMSENAGLLRKLKSLTEELDNERDKNKNCLKDQRNEVDIHLKEAQQRLRETQEKLSAYDIKIVKLLSEIKVLENQIKIKDTSLEHKAKEFQKLKKSTGEQVTKLEKQKSILETRINELKEDVNKKESEAEIVITDLQSKLNEAKQITEEAVRSREQTESELEMSKRRVKEVEEKCRQIIDMAEKTKTADESKHSERETELWTELQSTRGLLKSAEVQVHQLKEEKVYLMETVKMATEQNEGHVREIRTEYSSEINQKNEHIKTLQLQVKELTDSIAKKQEHIDNLEGKAKEYQDLISKAQNDNPTAIAGLQCSEFQEKLLELQTSLPEVLSQNKQMEQALFQKQLEAEQKERVMHEQRKVLRIRDELIGLLKGKEQRQEEQISSLQYTLDQREKDFEEMKKAIANKSEKMQELSSTLESKQTQVIRLEKLVKQLEEQNERSQAQCTRHETMIAQMEKWNQRYFSSTPHDSSVSARNLDRGNHKIVPLNRKGTNTVRPLDVRMLGENQPLSASNEYEVACQTFGSRPPANISWWKSGLLLDRNRQTTSADGNVTTSILTFTPQVDDTGKSLTCRAENIHIRGSAQEDSWSLNVHYSPIVSLELGSNLNGSLIREGVDVYFDCIIQANPWVNKVTWKHNGQELQNNVSMGTILSNQTLILQSVSRKISGMYTCQGSNSEGDTESKAFHLDVKYEPECSVGQQRVYGAARHEQVTVLCQVDANPPANLFRWSFNNSAVQSVQVDSVISEPGGGRSLASYKPQSERDYGTLLCWGRNELGSQAVPCVFHVVPAGKPDSPRNCVVVNRTSTSVLVNCVKGFDGGLPQDFVMEVFSAADGQRRLISNISSSTKPEFVVAGLEPGTGYFVSVYAANGKGRSSSSTLSVSTLKSTHQEHRRTAVATTFPSFPQVSPILWILAGVLVTLSLVGLIALITFRIKGGLCSCFGQEDDDQHTSTGSAESDIDATRKVQSSTSGNLLTVDLQAVKGSNLVTSEEMDERNPDVIPHTAEMEYPVEKLNMESIGRSSSVEAQTPKTMNYSNIPHYSSSETVQVEGAPVRWQPPRTAAATMTQNAETQTQTHKESAV